MAEKLQYELVVSTRATGTGAKDTRREIDLLKTAVDGLTQKVRVQEFASYDLDAAEKKLAAGAKSAKMTQAELDMQRVMAKRTLQELAEAEQMAAVQGGAATKSTRNLGMATLEASRAFEDAQYGMRGVLNNIPGLIAMLGGSAGLAGVVSVAAVGFSILYKEVEKFQKEAKEAEAAGEEMTEALREFLKEVEGRNLDGFIADMERFAQTEQNLADASSDALTLEAERRQSLERVSEKLREAAALEIKLAEARGQLTPAEARAQLNLLEGEAEAAVAQAQIQLLEDKVAMARKAYNDQLASIESLRRQEADLERSLAEQQGRSQELNQRAQAIRDTGDREGLPPGLRRTLETLESEVAAIDAAAKKTVEELGKIPDAIAGAEVDAQSLAQDIDNALSRRQIGASEIEQIADIAERGAQTALTIAAEEARSALQEQATAAAAEGRQLGEEARAAFGVLNAALADGQVKSSELERVTEVIQRATAGQEQLTQRVVSAFDRVLSSADKLTTKVAAQDTRINALESRVNALNNQRR